MPTGGVMSSRAIPRSPANSGWAKGGGACAVRTGVDPHPMTDPIARKAPERRRSRRVILVIPLYLYPRHRFSSQFQRTIDVLVRVRRAQRALLRGQREVIDPVVDELAAVAPVEIEVVARRQVVPVGRDVVAEVGDERRPDAADDGLPALLPV